jgi:hypothetical protein
MRANSTPDSFLSGAVATIVLFAVFWWAFASLLSISLFGILDFRPPWCHKAFPVLGGVVLSFLSVKALVRRLSMRNGRE